MTEKQSTKDNTTYEFVCVGYQGAWLGVTGKAFQKEIGEYLNDGWTIVGVTVDKSSTDMTKYVTHHLMRARKK